MRAALPSASPMLQEIGVSPLLFLSTVGAEGQEKGAAALPTPIPSDPRRGQRLKWCPGDRDALMTVWKGFSLERRGQTEWAGPALDQKDAGKKGEWKG